MLTPRALYRALKIAQTVAALEGRGDINQDLYKIITVGYIKRRWNKEQDLMVKEVEELWKTTNKYLGFKISKLEFEIWVKGYSRKTKDKKHDREKSKKAEDKSIKMLGRRAEILRRLVIRRLIENVYYTTRLLEISSIARTMVEKTGMKYYETGFDEKQEEARIGIAKLVKQSAFNPEFAALIADNWTDYYYPTRGNMFAKISQYNIEMRY